MREQGPRRRSSPHVRHPSTRQAPTLVPSHSNTARSPTSRPVGRSESLASAPPPPNVPVKRTGYAPDWCHGACAARALRVGHAACLNPRLDNVCVDRHRPARGARSRSASRAPAAPARPAGAVPPVPPQSRPLTGALGGRLPGLRSMGLSRLHASLRSFMSSRSEGRSGTGAAIGAARCACCG